MPADHLDGPIDRITFADAPQVDLNSRPIEADCQVIGIEPQVLPAGSGPGISQRLGFGNPLWPADKAPGLRECTRGHIVSPSRKLAQRHCPLEQAEEPALDRNGREVSRRIQPADLGLVVVDRQLRLELVDQVERAVGQLQSAGNPCAQTDLEKRAHGRPMHAEQIVCRSSRLARFRARIRHLGAIPPQPQEIAPIDAGSRRFHAGLGEVARGQGGG